MFDILDRQIRLTGNQKKIITAAVIGDALEFFDYFLIGFVLAFLTRPLERSLSDNRPSCCCRRGSAPILGAYTLGLAGRTASAAGQGFHRHRAELLGRQTTMRRSWACRPCG